MKANRAWLALTLLGLGPVTAAKTRIDRRSSAGLSVSTKK